MRNIFVYSLPRSGTNFFSTYLHLHDQLGAVNAQRYFLAGAFLDSPRSYPILRGAGTKKNWDGVSAIVFDEVRPFLMQAFSQDRQRFFALRRFLRELSANRLLTFPSTEVFLYRNPIKIAESLNAYAVKHNRSYWKISTDEELTFFYRYYRDFLSRILRKKAVQVADIAQIMSSEDCSRRFFQNLNLGSCLGSYDAAQRNALCGACGSDLQLPTGIFDGNAAKCGSCGALLEGFGGFNVAARFDHGRFSGLQGVDLDMHVGPLTRVFGAHLGQDFLANKLIAHGSQDIRDSFLTEIS